MSEETKKKPEADLLEIIREILFLHFSQTKIYFAFVLIQNK